MMLLFLGVYLYRAASTGSRAWLESRSQRLGPFAVLCLAGPLILADTTRHLLQDYGVWHGCGNNQYFSRINTSDPFPDACFWSSSQYRCSVPCCVPVWREQANGTYGWTPPTPEKTSPKFATLASNGREVYFPRGFDFDAPQPYRLYTAPLVLFEDSTVLLSRPPAAPAVRQAPPNPLSCPSPAARSILWLSRQYESPTACTV